MKVKLFMIVPGKYYHDYLLERKEHNRKHLLISGLVVMLIQLIFVAVSIWFPFTNDNKVITNYRTFYFVCMGLNLVFFCLLFLNRNKDLREDKKIVLLLIPYLFVLHFWGMGVAVADLFQGEQVVVYYLTMYALAIFFEMGILEFLILLMTVYLVFTVQLRNLIPLLGPRRELLFASFQHVLFSTFLRYHIGELKRKNFIQRKELEFYSYYDFLSGLYNRRKWEELYHDIYKTACREGRKLTLLLVDIDYFKQFNDTYGHVAGDDAVRLTSQILRESVEGLNAYVGRYGGDEFVLVIQDSSIEEIHELISRINGAIRGLNIKHEASPRDKKLALSIGVNHHIPENLDLAWDFVVKADQDLYAQKAKRVSR
jgi:diguanylate cyclase (GGDEF)-like protein